MLDGRNDPAFHLAFLTKGESIDQLQPMPFKPVGLTLVLIAAFGAICAFAPLLWAMEIAI